VLPYKLILGLHQPKLTLAISTIACNLRNQVMKKHILLNIAISSLALIRDVVIVLKQGLGSYLSDLVELIVLGTISVIA